VAWAIELVAPPLPIKVVFKPWRQRDRERKKNIKIKKRRGRRGGGGERGRNERWVVEFSLLVRVQQEAVCITPTRCEHGCTGMERQVSFLEEWVQYYYPRRDLSEFAGRRNKWAVKTTKATALTRLTLCRFATKSCHSNNRYLLLMSGVGSTKGR
jgi:hypothetical protein